MLFERLFQQAFEKRQAFSRDDLTTAFRIFNGEGDGLGGLTIDWYDGYLLLTWYNDSLYQMKPLLLEACQAVLKDIQGIYEKNRFDLQGLPESQHIAGAKAPEPLIVKENGVSFATYLDDGMMTGIFLDQKEVRGRLVNGPMAVVVFLIRLVTRGLFQSPRQWEALSKRRVWIWPKEVVKKLPRCLKSIN